MDSCFYIPLECLYFLIISPYYGNSIYPCFRNYVLEIVWIFASREIFKKFIIFECWFSHTFPVLWESTFPMFWELYGFLLHAKYVRNPDFGIFFSSYFFRTIGIHFLHVLETMLLMWKLFRSYFHSNIMWNFSLNYPILCRTHYLHFKSLCHRSTEIYTVQKSRQCLVRQCFSCNIPMNFIFIIRLKTAPSGLQQKRF